MSDAGPLRLNGLTTGIALLSILLGGCFPKEEPTTPFQTAQKPMAAEQWSEARRSFERELALHPDNLDARYDLALLLADNGHKADAAGLYEENLSHGWHLASAINLAQYRQHAGQLDDATRLLMEATRKSPHEAIPWYLLAEISAEQKQLQTADEQFRQAIKADPRNGFARLRYASFLAGEKKFDEALKYAKQATHLLPDCAPCWRQYGDILGAAGQHVEAVTAYQRSLAINPRATETRQQLIDAIRNSGDIDRANRMQRALNNYSPKAEAGPSSPQGM